MRKTLLIGLAVVTAVAATSIAMAQQGGIKRTPLQKVEFPDGYNTVTGIAEIQPGGTAGRHTHPGIETGYILEGEADLVIEGQPDKHLKAGDSYAIPAGVVHDAKVHGDKALKVLGIYIVDKTKPLATPAP
ncbi:cupin domain-containing protein [Bradyrhizobium sp. U87765 SZCCT0131]|uniref:cupin domain-containing protein n=2 Tax=Bradyrhizobium TaxID=374 RepID=UPI001BA865B3|nr:cupin domain-containing protein [Bradyrhizobium sp. U87765 SZCCT0131]MBR1262577.1 cupin domain-containing protein [Bradyrhizobium sp. U87765 SZCCT0134]MBR1308951.1 cupin domain-containing protein [Bradyrhizobium sp. U87765 SZCCT0110]MBR1318359.1 cupin domain-containing protein [Bradyrhizobium sp. U87765 SZCCT0109]MBR1352063.1 cupin domain-containing protein [Bradyrhizobium sp. U87765 SZCCT0048]